MVLAKEIEMADKLFKNLVNEFDEKNNIDNEVPNKIRHLNRNYALSEILKSLENPSNTYNYSQFVDFSEKINNFNEAIQRLKDDIDLEKFYKNGKIVDWKKLRKEYETKNLHKRYKLDWVKLKDWINNPRLELINCKGETVHYNKYVVKKTNLAILQMIFNEMDIYELLLGAEGSGKSCYSSQRVLYYYTFLKEIGLINYFLDVKKMYFTDVSKMLESHEMDKETLFEIQCLDESNKLNRQNYREDESIDFKNEMRTERTKQRIMLLNMQQIGELDTSITLSRVNFITFCDMDSNIKTGTLQKGKASLMIIPRGKKIYSEYLKKEIYRSEIKSILSKFLESKNQYYKDLPDELVVKKFNFQNVWGFDKSEYDKHKNKSNKIARTSTKDIKITDYLGYILLKKMPPLKNWDLDRNNATEKKMYNSLAKFQQQLKYRIASKPNLKQQFDLIYGDD